MHWYLSFIWQEFIIHFVNNMPCTFTILMASVTQQTLFNFKIMTFTVQSKRKFTLASARHASALDITRARIASRGTVTHLYIDRKHSLPRVLLAVTVHSARVCSHAFIQFSLQSIFRAKTQYLISGVL